MNLANLVNMANRIAEFHASWPDQDAAVLAISEHIRKFWAPRMRRDLIQAVTIGTASDLHPLVHRALLSQRDGLMPN